MNQSYEKLYPSPISYITNQSNRRYLGLLLVFLSSIFFIFVLNFPGQHTRTVQYKQVDKVSPPLKVSLPKNCTPSYHLWTTWTSFVRFCLSDRIRSSEQSTWRTLHHHVGACVGEAGWRMLGPKALRNRDDVKFAILPQKDKVMNFDGNLNFPPFGHFGNCTVVTLGIGNDVEAELKLQSLLPGCRFFGADPSAEQGRVYEHVLHGRYFQTAVGHQDGLTKANILERDGYHIRDQIPTKNFLDFLIRDVQSPKIDYLLMDNEGAEYGILRQFFTSPMLDQENMVVCQLSVELHGPLDKYGMNETAFQRLIVDILSRSPMLPIWSAEPVNHMRSFYINVQNPYCIEKYFLYERSACKE